MKITKAQFLKEVSQEIENIKQHAFKKEIKNLELDSFNPNQETRCIYGQLTGDCSSDRAIKLIKKCCIRYMDFENSNVKNERFLENYFVTKPFNSIKSAINGTKMPKEFFSVGSWYNHRIYDYLSALEAWIMMPESNHEGIIDYLKGNTDKLVLSKKK